MPYLIFTSLSSHPYLTFSTTIAQEFRSWSYTVESIPSSDPRIAEIHQHDETSFSQYRNRPPLSEVWERELRRRCPGIEPGGSGSGGSSMGSSGEGSNGGDETRQRGQGWFAGLMRRMGVQSDNRSARSCSILALAQRQSGRRSTDRERGIARRRTVEYIVHTPPDENTSEEGALRPRSYGQDTASSIEFVNYGGRSHSPDVFDTEAFEFREMVQSVDTSITDADLSEIVQLAYSRRDNDSGDRPWLL
ncbi:hypothetical protein B0J11DRAFT_504112 [Dendryphion nanum]|uniref:Uncharacterized protein n=1 Tax=Dendryphion nanum TaxID=256645 RepID=A0A9P9E3D9_9PLEO|nr:hypothetical protein B0J11DRAFT_504112 [Dendryphion nanum]